MRIAPESQIPQEAAMNVGDVIGLILAALLVVYLLYALLHPEEL